MLRIVRASDPPASAKIHPGYMLSWRCGVTALLVSYIQGIRSRSPRLISCLKLVLWRWCVMVPAYCRDFRMNCVCTSGFPAISSCGSITGNWHTWSVAPARNSINTSVFAILIGMLKSQPAPLPQSARHSADIRPRTINCLNLRNSIWRKKCPRSMCNTGFIYKVCRRSKIEL